MKTKTTTKKTTLLNFTKTLAIAFFIIIGLKAQAQIPCIASFTYTINPANNGQVSFTNASSGTTGTTSYTWYFTGGSSGPTSNLQNPSYTFSNSGTYVVCLRITDSVSGAMCNAVFCDTLNVLNNSTAIKEQFNTASSLNSYPNPFSKETTISFFLNQEGEIDLSIYDVVGKKVATIEKGVKTSGKHSVNWNAEGLNQGIYLLQLKVNNQVITKKIILTK